MKKVIVAAFLVAIAFFVAPCIDDTCSVSLEMVVPDGYSGKLLLREDAQKGQIIHRWSPRNTLLFDLSGEAKIQDRNVLLKHWLGIDIHFQSGKKIEKIYGSDAFNLKADDDTVYAFDYIDQGKLSPRYYVGTFKKAKANGVFNY